MYISLYANYDFLSSTLIRYFSTEFSNWQIYFASFQTKFQTNSTLQMRVTATQNTHFIYDVETYTTKVTPKKDNIFIDSKFRLYLVIIRNEYHQERI